MSDKRQQIIDTATRLFRRHGFHATGVDRVARESQITKRTMYSYFRSKDELILAVLRDYDGQYRNQFMKAVTEASEDPQQRLLAIFDIAYDWFQQNDFFGCTFINTVGEYAEGHEAIRDVCREHKRLLFEFILGLAKDTGLPNPDYIARTIDLLFQGAIVTAQVSRDHYVARGAKAAAEVVLASARLKASA